MSVEQRCITLLPNGMVHPTDTHIGLYLTYANHPPLVFCNWILEFCSISFLFRQKISTMDEGVLKCMTNTIYDLVDQRKINNLDLLVAELRLIAPVNSELRTKWRGESEQLGPNWLYDEARQIVKNKTLFEVKIGYQRGVLFSAI